MAVMQQIKAFATVWQALAMLVFIGVLFFGWQHWAQKPSTFPVQKVRVEGAFTHLNVEQVHDVLNEFVKTGLFALNDQLIKQKLEHLPWVSSASLRRVWPETLVVSIEEQIPVAHWNGQQLLNKQGEVFNTSAPIVLPELAGRDAFSKNVLTTFQQMNQSLEKKGVQLSALTQTEHGSWQAVLAQGQTVMLGKGKPQEKLEKSIAVLTEMGIEMLNRVQAIDLRYPNGMAVIWQESAEEESVMKATITKQQQTITG